MYSPSKYSIPILPMFPIIFSLVAIILIISGGIFLAMQRVMEMKNLAERGITAQGNVTGKRSVTSPRSSTRRQKLDYRFKDQRGGEYSNTTVLTYAEYDQYKVGDAIEIAYLPERPSINGLKSFVDLARDVKR